MMFFFDIRVIRYYFRATVARMQLDIDNWNMVTGMGL